MTVKESNLIWLDLEMTGLDPDSHRILEIATIATDSELQILAEGPVFAIHQPQDCLESMGAWCIKHHTQSGLVARVQASTITEEEAEAKTLDFIKQYIPPQQSPLCGNSISQDRRFLYRYMPQLEEYFHYRNIDVSTLKELAKRWSPEVVKSFKKESQHVALQDIYDSIAELRHYREQVWTA
ncbi:MAG: oligoribonuclease [Gammaproteobacteria bacterium]